MSDWTVVAIGFPVCVLLSALLVIFGGWRLLIVPWVLAVVAFFVSLFLQQQGWVSS